MKANDAQKAVYKQMVFEAMKSIYSPKALQMLKSGMTQGDPAEDVASLVATTVRPIMDAARKAGHNVDMRYVLPVGREVVAHTVEMLVGTGNIDQKEAPGLVQKATALFAEIVGAKQQPAGMLAQGG